MESSGGDGDGDDGDDDPNEVQLDDGDDGFDLPPPGRNFPGRLLPTGELFSLVSFRPVEAAKLSVDDVLCLRVTGGRSTRKGVDPGGPGPRHHLLARQGVHPRRQWCGPHMHHLVPPFGSPRHLG